MLPEVPRSPCAWPVEGGLRCTRKRVGHSYDRPRNGPTWAPIQWRRRHYPLGGHTERERPRTSAAACLASAAASTPRSCSRPLANSARPGQTSLRSLAARPLPMEHRQPPARAHPGRTTEAPWRWCCSSTDSLAHRQRRREPPAPGRPRSPRRRCPDRHRPGLRRLEGGPCERLRKGRAVPRGKTVRESGD